MTKKELRQYCSLKREVDMLYKRLDKLYERDVPVVAGKVQASAKEFPYIQYRVGVQMYEPEMNDEICKTIRILDNRVEQCNMQMRIIEEFIDKIEDSELRQMFELRYIEGMKLKEIARVMNVELSGPGKKISSYLNLSNISKK